MAYPGDPSGPASKGGSAFVTGRLTPDDFEQLAAAFRPSWEFDEAPFTGPGSMTASELRALQGAGGTYADIRPGTPLTNGVYSHPVVSPPHVTATPQDSVIVERALTAADVPQPANAPAPTPAPTPFGPPVIVHAAPSAAPAPSLQARPSSADRLAQTRIVQRPFPAAIPSPKESTGSFDVGFRRSKKPLWIGLGVGALALGAIGIWATSGGSSQAPAPAAVVVATTAAQPSPNIPPPPETTFTPVAPPPKTVPVSALAQVPTPVQTAAPPAPRAAPAPPAAAPPRPVAPAPRPAARPKPAGGTIVHDVPF